MFDRNLNRLNEIQRIGGKKKKKNYIQKKNKKKLISNECKMIK